VICLVETKPCIACGKLTTRVLFRESSAEVFICSLACETQYFESLSYKKDEQQKVLQYLDEKIRRTKQYETVAWASVAIGLLLILLGIFWANSPATKELILGPMLFMTGIIPLTCGALSTLYFGSRREKLKLRRKQLA